MLSLKSTWTPGIRVTELDKALRVLGVVLEVGLLDSSGVEAGFPPTVEGDLLVDRVTDVANVQGLEKRS